MSIKKINKIKNSNSESAFSSSDVSKQISEESLELLFSTISVVREPFMVLNNKLDVLLVNEAFYRTFQLDKSTVMEKNIFEISNNGWDITELRKLLEITLIKNDFFNGFELNSEFPYIGRKIFIINARRFRVGGGFDNLNSIILLAMEDVTELLLIAEKLAGQANVLEARMVSRLVKVEQSVEALEKEILNLKLQ